MNFEEYVREALEEIKSMIGRQDKRIRHLENWRSFIVGGLTIITFIVILTSRVFGNLP